MEGTYLIINHLLVGDMPIQSALVFRTSERLLEINIPAYFPQRTLLIVSCVDRPAVFSLLYPGSSGIYCRSLPALERRAMVAVLKSNADKKIVLEYPQFEEPISPALQALRLRSGLEQSF